MNEEVYKEVNKQIEELVEKIVGKLEKDPTYRGIPLTVESTQTIGMARAKVKIGLANLTYNMTRAAWLTTRGAPV